MRVARRKNNVVGIFGTKTFGEEGYSLMCKKKRIGDRMDTSKTSSFAENNGLFLPKGAIVLC